MLWLDKSCLICGGCDVRPRSTKVQRVKIQDANLHILEKKTRDHVIISSGWWPCQTGCVEGGCSGTRDELGSLHSAMGEQTPFIGPIQLVHCSPHSQLADRRAPFRRDGRSTSIYMITVYLMISRQPETLTNPYLCPTILPTTFGTQK